MKPENEIEYIGRYAARPYTPVVRFGDLLFVSGQASTNDAGEIIPDTFEGEFLRSLENLRALLQSAGSDLDRVIQVRAYVRDAEDVPLYNRLYREHFPQPFPARTTLTGCLAAIRFEIECIAAAGPAPE
jgi:2-iminobutanoate/2-iminopropanoate deaminase